MVTGGEGKGEWHFKAAKQPAHWSEYLVWAAALYTYYARTRFKIFFC